MGLVELAWLLVAGFAMGAINNVAGAAGVLGLLGLELASGLSPALANGSLRLAAIGIGIGGWLGFHSKGIAIPRRAWLLALCTVPGTLLGVELALELPVSIYRTYLLVVMLAVLVQQLRNRSLAPATTHRSPWLAFLGLSIVGMHMGFVQVGTGLVAILALTAFYSRNLVEVNTCKMALVLVSAVVSVGQFGANDAVVWGPASALAVAAALGSFLASRWSIAKGHAGVRIVVLVITVAVVVRTAWQLAAA